MNSIGDSGERPPHWDLSPFFPSLGSREFAAAAERVGSEVARLGERLDDLDIGAGDPLEVDDRVVAVTEELIATLNRLRAEMRLVGAYLHGLVSTDVTDAEAAGALSRFQASVAPLRALDGRFGAWLARLDLSELGQHSPQISDHAYPLRRRARASRHLMSDAEEDLAAEMSLTGGRAWARLHSDVTARLTAEVNGEELPMSAVRGLASSPEAGRRREAFEAELVAWDSVSVPLAAALNGFKGEANILNRRRRWGDSLDPALERNGVTPEILAAMQSAVVESFPHWRRYLRAKARLLGHSKGLPWWDLLAPVGTHRTFDWGDVMSLVREGFGTYSPRLAELVRRAEAEGWIDAEARDGKVGGAYCMSVEGEVSRVLCNFDGSFNSVRTVAHELGHAYHNLNLGHRTPLQRDTPMALAETASIFCETIIIQAGLAAVGDDRAGRLALIDADLAAATQVVVDIHSRFLFERALTTEREKGVVSVARLRQLMAEAQKATYGDGLDPDHLHRDMWAVKGHYFTAYYNWPYTFGLLFGIGLYARYRSDPERFRAGYDDLLSATGLADADTLAARFGIDVTRTRFWGDALAVLISRIDEFEQLALAGERPNGPSGPGRG